MKLDFSKCQTKEDVERVIRESGLPQVMSTIRKNLGIEGGTCPTRPQQSSAKSRSSKARK
jgi:hypothetical protein